MMAQRFVALLCLLLPLFSDDAQALKRACPTCAVRCNIYATAPPVWALVDGTCKIFWNGCAYSSESCQRQGRCLSKMEMTTQELCQKSCPTYCSARRQLPVCATYLISIEKGEPREETVTFANQCELDKAACLNAKPYLSATIGACGSPTFEQTL